MTGAEREVRCVEVEQTEAAGRDEAGRSKGRLIAWQLAAVDEY